MDLVRNATTYYRKADRATMTTRSLHLRLEAHDSLA